jgi:hypothetical protein
MRTPTKTADDNTNTQSGGNPLGDALVGSADVEAVPPPKKSSLPTSPATTAPTNESFYTYRSHDQNKVNDSIQVQLTHMLLKTLRRKLRKGFLKDEAPTIANLCKKKYKELCMSTFVVSAIPFINDERGNQCRINYQTGKAESIGPFVVCCKQSFEDFVENGDFNRFVQRRFDDIANATDKNTNKKGHREVLNAPRVCLFAEYNTKPYDFEGDKPPENEETKLKKNIEKYSKIVKAKRDREQHEWLEMHRAMQAKRRQVLREEQKFAINNVYEKLLADKEVQYNMVLPRTIMPNYDDAQAFRPRYRPTRHYERQRKRRATIKNYTMAANEDYDDYAVATTDVYDEKPVNQLMDDKATDAGRTSHPPKNTAKSRRVSESGRRSRGRRSSFT